MTTVVNFLFTPQSAIIITDDGRAHTALKTSADFQRITGLLLAGKKQEALEMLDKSTAIKKVSKGHFNIVDGNVVIDGEVLPPALSNKLIALLESGQDTSRLESFWDNLSLNPSEQSKADLFKFLEANKFPLTKDGCFLAYKKVRDDWKDCHTGSFDNSPGKVVSVDRANVDPDSSRTCSYGLHVAAHEYAKGFSSGRLLEVKVNPADVVSVPPDHSQQKIRTCKYVVLREVPEDQPECSTEIFDGDEGAAPIVEALGVVKVHVDGEGRLRIPGKFVRSIGCGVGHTVKVVASNDVVTVENIETPYASQDAELATYKVQDDNSVRLSASVLDQAGFGRRSVINVEKVDGVLCLS
jgi:hypothetical protein